MVQVLGTGATARAFKVDRDGWDSVLKVSRSEDAALRLMDEYSTLENLRHDHLVGARRGLFQVGERHAIELDFAGPRSLAQLLRTEGALLPDQLQRYGDQLLDVLGYLERKQVHHRDIKPDNLGIREHPKLGNSLVLFDFSLAGVPATDLQAGTRGYVDPFLDGTRRPVYDAAAERYAAAVTLHEMASLELPSWNADGTDPAFGGDVVLSSELFAAPLRDQLVEFFTKALHRDTDRRHQSVAEMRSAWRRIFTTIDRTGPATNSLSDSEDPSELRDEAAEQAKLDTALDAAGLSPRAVAVAQRLGAQTVGDLVDLPYRTLWNARGLSKRTRQELVNRHTQWRRSLLGGTAEDGPTTGDALVTPLDRIVPSLVPAPRRRADSQVAITRLLLGLPDDADVLPGTRWPTNVEVAASCGLTSGRIAQVLSARRKAWAADRTLRALHEELVEALTGLRRVATAAELAERVLGLHGCADTVPMAQRLPLAYAVCRAVIERDVLADEPRFAIRRHHGRILVALQATDEDPLDMVSDAQLLDLAADLGDAAKELAAEDPLPTPTAVVRRLLERAKQMDWVWGERRLVQLAASASGTVLSNARMELYPRDLDPARALRLAQAGAGLPDEGLTATALRQRVTNRFPGLTPLPDGRDLLNLCGLRAELGRRTVPPAVGVGDRAGLPDAVRFVVRWPSGGRGQRHRGRTGATGRRGAPWWRPVRHHSPATGPQGSRAGRGHRGGAGARRLRELRADTPRAGGRRGHPGLRGGAACRRRRSRQPRPAEPVAAADQDVRRPRRGAGGQAGARVGRAHPTRSLPRGKRPAQPADRARKVRRQRRGPGHAGPDLPRRERAAAPIHRLVHPAPGHPGGMGRRHLDLAGTADRSSLNSSPTSVTSLAFDRMFDNLVSWTRSSQRCWSRTGACCPTRSCSRRYGGSRRGPGGCTRSR